LLLIYGSVAYVAWQSGQSLREEQVEQQTEEELARQFALAENDAAAGNFDLALRRLTWVQERSPGYPGLQALWREIEISQTLRLTPSPTPVSSPTPTITPTPEPLTELANLQALVEDGSWEEAIEAILVFQAANPSYERDHTDRLLYESYLAFGLELLNSPQVELGVSYIERAEDLGPLSQEILDQLYWADLYLNGIAFYGVDWVATIGYFSDLCLVAPFFQDACARLYEARLAYAEQLAFGGEHCPAEQYYRDALAQDYTRDVAEAVEGSRLICLEATPTPSATPEMTGTPDAEGTPAPEFTPTPEP
jgi:hypothetical protein